MFICFVIFTISKVQCLVNSVNLHQPTVQYFLILFSLCRHCFFKAGIVKNPDANRVIFLIPTSQITLDLGE